MTGPAASDPRSVWLLIALLVLAGVGAGLYYWYQSRQPAAPVQTEFTHVEPDGVLLMDAFESYASLAAVRQRLSAAGMQPEHKPQHFRGSGEAPPYNLDTLTIESTQHLGVSGGLELEFLNDRLYSATFRPDRARDYLAKLNPKSLGLEKARVSLWEVSRDNLRVSTNLPYAVSDVGRSLATEGFVRWEDVRLAGQLQRWYEQYGRPGVLQYEPATAQ